MELRKFLQTLEWAAILVVILSTVVIASDEDSEQAQSDRHENRPRFLGFFSRPKPEAPKETGIGLKHHFGNVLNGGTIGFQAEFRPLEKVHGVIDHAKKFIPIPGFFGGTVGEERPVKEYPDEKPIKVYPEEKPIKVYPEEKPIKENPWKKPDENHENVESEGPYGWLPQDPKKPKPEGPKWEDIGEEDSEEKDDVPPEDYVTEPIEDIIQPRIRPKRFAEAKVYHVPLEFLSNAKPMEVKIKNDNHV